MASDASSNERAEQRQKTSRKTTVASEFALAITNIRVDSASPLPIYAQIVLALRSSIGSGDLPPGTALPSSRELADFLGVSRTTTGLAYSRLTAEGYLTSHRRRGTRVAQNPTGLVVAPLSVPLVAAMADTADTAPKLPNEPVDIAYQAHLKLGKEGPSRQEQELDISGPDASLYPRVTLGRLLAQEFARPPTPTSNHKGRFQRAIANYLRQTRGVRCQAEQIIPVPNTQCALDLLAQVLIDPGHSLYVEDPAPNAIRATFRRAGARIFPLPTEMLSAAMLAQAAPPPRVIFVSPSNNIPLGTQMASDRRTAILRAAVHVNAIVVEYDAGQEIVFAGSRGPAMQADDHDHNVIYFGSLYETLGPYIQLTYLIVPSALVDAFGCMAEQLGYTPSLFTLGAVAIFIEETEYAMHVKSLRGIYGERAMLLEEGSRSRFGDASMVQPVGGLCATLRLQEDVSEAALCQAARPLGIAIAPLSEFYQILPARSGVVFGLGSLPDRLIDGALDRFAELIENSARAAA